MVEEFANILEDIIQHPGKIVTLIKDEIINFDELKKILEEWNIDSNNIYTIKYKNFIFRAVFKKALNLNPGIYLPLILENVGYDELQKMYENPHCFIGLLPERRSL